MQKLGVYIQWTWDQRRHKIVYKTEIQVFTEISTEREGSSLHWLYTPVAIRQRMWAVTTQTLYLSSQVYITNHLYLKLRKNSYRSSPIVPQLLFCLDLIQLEGCNFLCWIFPLAIYCYMHWNIWLVTLKTTKHGNINNWYTQTKILCQANKKCHIPFCSHIAFTNVQNEPSVQK